MELGDNQNGWKAKARASSFAEAEKKLMELAEANPAEEVREDDPAAPETPR